MADQTAVPFAEADLTLGNDPLADLSRLTGVSDPEPDPAPGPVEEPEAVASAEDTEPDDEVSEDVTDEGEPETPATPSDASQSPAPDASLDALLKAGTPFKYVVDGVEKETADIVEVAGKGAVIPPDALNRVRDRLQQADRLGDQNKKLYAEATAKERAHEEALAARERDVAKLEAAGSLFLDLLENPRELMALLNPDGSLNVDRQQFLIRQMQVAAKEAEFKARETFEQRRNQAQSATQEAETRRVLMDTQLAELTAGLPPEDVEAAKAFFGPMAHILYRQATAEDVAKYPGAFQVGQTIFDAPRIEQWVADRKAVRAQLTESAKAKSAASKHNAAVQSAPTTKPLPPRNQNTGQFKKAPTPKEKPKMSRYERNLAVLNGVDVFGTDQ